MQEKSKPKPLTLSQPPERITKKNEAQESVRRRNSFSPQLKWTGEEQLLQNKQETKKEKNKSILGRSVSIKKTAKRLSTKLQKSSPSRNQSRTLRTSAVYSRGSHRRTSKIWRDDEESYGTSIKKRIKNCIPTRKKNCPVSNWSVFLPPPSTKYIIDPMSTAKQWWDTVVLLAVVWNTLSIPFYVAFSPPSLLVASLDYVFDSLFILDLLMSFRVAVADPYGNGGYSSDYRYIARRYFKFWFWIDILAVLPMELFFSGEEAQLGNAVKMFRLLRMGRLIQAIDQQGSSRFLGKIVRLMLVIVVIGHWVACVWALINSAEDDAWRITMGAENDSLFDWYTMCLLNAFYQMIGTTTVFPETSGQRVFCSIILLFGAVIWGMIFGNMSLLLRELDQEKELFNQKIGTVQREMKHLHLSDHMSSKILRYYELLWQQDRARFLGISLLGDLNGNLRREVLRSLWLPLLKAVPLFKTCTQSVFDAILGLLRLEIVLEGDVVFNEGDIGDAMYFLVDGTVEAYSIEKDLFFATLEAGSFFGEVALTISNVRTATIRAVVGCELLALAAHDFEVMLKDFPDFAEVVHRSSSKISEGTEGLTSRKHSVRSPERLSALSAPMSLVSEQALPDKATVEARLDTLDKVVWITQKIFERLDNVEKNSDRIEMMLSKVMEQVCK